MKPNPDARQNNGDPSNWDLMPAFFNSEAIDAVKRKLQGITPRHIVYCSFESRFARSGGLAAVTHKIPPFLAAREPVEHVLLMTPFYPHIIDETKLETTGITFQVPFDNRQVTVELLMHIPFTRSPGSGVVEEYYIKADGFFQARNSLNDPYGYFPDDPERNHTAILHNALFYCQAVPRAVSAAGFYQNILFHLQDWQTALIALTGKEAVRDKILGSCVSAPTLHNLFDSPVTVDLLAKITPNQSMKHHPFFTAERAGADEPTVLQVGLQLTDRPVTTVSEHFAEELTTDLLQTGHFAPKLQYIFKKTPVLGVNNGMFVDFPPEYARDQALTPQAVKKIKNEKRKALLEILDTYRPAERFGVLTYKSRSIKRLPRRVPIMVMSGRLDPFQKGFDILLRAVEKFREDEIKLVMTPMAVRDSDLDFFRETAERCNGNVTVFPIRMRQGYHELQLGSTFGVMPSIYEPFGAAVEYMTAGTVTVARETGGLADQVSHGSCGILYREPPETYTLENIEAYSETCDDVRERQENPWVQAMTDALYNALEDAAALYQDRPNDYYQMILEGFKQARTFTWQKAAKEYTAVFKQPVSKKI